MRDLLRGEIVTIVPLNSEGRRSASSKGCFRAVVLDLHYDDPRRAIVMERNATCRRVVWRSEIQHDDAPTFANFPSKGMTLTMNGVA